MRTLLLALLCSATLNASNMDTRFYIHSPLLPVKPAPVVVVVEKPLPRTYVLTLRQYLHVQHSQWQLLLQTAKTPTDRTFFQDEVVRAVYQLSYYTPAQLDAPYTGPLEL